MNEQEWNKYRTSSHEADLPMVGPVDDDTKTLLYGYDVDRNTYHVFQHEHQLHLLVYKPDYEKPADDDGKRQQVVLKHEVGHALPVRSLIPNKRLYPERCDYTFCNVLRGKGADLSFTTFDPERVTERAIVAFTNVPEIDDPVVSAPSL